MDHYRFGQNITSGRLKLRHLHPGDESSFKNALDMFKDETPPFEFAFDFDESVPFIAYIQKLERWSLGKELPDKFVPNTFLAGRGYIVLSVLHPKNNYLDDSSGRTTENWIHRSRHISTALDGILNDGRYRGFIDGDKIAVIGFSAGGYTALSLAGGIPDTAGIVSHCSENRDDTEFCGGNALSSGSGSFSASGSGERGRIIENTSDSRIKAAVLLAPLGVLFNSQRSLAGVTVPLRIYRAKKDQVLRYPYHAESIRQKLSFKPEYIVVENAGHYSFLSPFPESIQQEVGVVAEDPDGFDRIRFHRMMNQEIFTFLSTSLGI